MHSRIMLLRLLLLHYLKRFSNDKNIAAGEFTQGLRVFIVLQEKLLVTEEYIEFLLTTANQKMEENNDRYILRKLSRQERS